MSYIDFDKKELVNLKIALDRELLRTNRAGSYASTTIIATNTRKYHGLLVAPQPLIDDDKHVLISTLDETLITKDEEFHLSMRMYPGGHYHPKGHKYIRSFVSDPNPRLVYRLGKMVFSKEYIFAFSEDRILVRYTLEDAIDKLTLRIKPFLAYRNVHDLAKANTFVNNKYNHVDNGVSWQMYRGYSKVFLQFSKVADYTHVPDWYYNVEYIREAERGYPCQEDLFVPGFFDVEMKKGDSIVISIGLEEKNPANFKRQFTSEVKKRIPRDNYLHCLENAADEFIVKQNKKTGLIAGYPWFGRWGRDTFVAMPGLLLRQKDEKTYKEVIHTMLHELKDGLFPNLGQGKNAAFNSADSSLWFFWALQQWQLMTGKKAKLWKTYGKSLKSILAHFSKGTHFNIGMHKNGLIWQGVNGKALTWMDAVVNGKPITPRIGYAVEINALWYNAVMFALELAEEAGDKTFVNEWKKWPEVVKQSFKATFWDDQKGYLADVVNGEYKDWSVRPNMIFAVSMPYSPLGNFTSNAVVHKVKQELLTPRGLRTLSPKNQAYKGKYFGDQSHRDEAYHQGTVWPWLLGAFADAYLKLRGKDGKAFIESLYWGFEEVMSEAGIGTISEVYDGNPPHTAGGAISQAWNVAELLRIKWMLDTIDKN
ncbi:MAG: amylo-alpha-1,6-glucosidase [Bacteroidales bacterium]|nr:amylo-alpha-1,6-glucosidase [Bacteroidales bacterium]MCF6342355.1 amylo-alpha-1,6-glucosidase [Bacteroidales bacterium]